MPEVPNVDREPALALSDYAREKLQGKNFAYLATIMAGLDPATHGNQIRARLGVRAS